MLTVRDILEMPEYAEAVVIAGHAGLNNTVSNLSVLETDQLKEDRLYRDPNILFVSALSFIADDVEKQLSLIHFLHERGGSGLLIMFLSFFLKKVSPALIQLADELAFPLISIPSENKSYTDVITPAMSALFDDKNQSMGFALRLQKELYEMILAEKDVDFLIASVEKLLGKRIVLLDSNNKCIYQKSPGLDAVDLGLIIDKAIKNENKGSIITAEGMNIYYHPIIISKNYYGFLAVQDVDPTDTENLIITMGQLSMAIALLSIKTKRLEDQRETVKATFINDLVNWNFANEQSAIMRAYSLDINPLSKSLLLLLDMGAANGGQVKQEPPQSIYMLVRNLAERHNPRHAVFRYEQDFIILFNSESRDAGTIKEGLELGDEIVRRLAKSWPYAVKVGVSSCFDSCSKIPQAYQEAWKAVSIGRKVFKEDACICYDQLGAYVLLADLALDQRASSVLDTTIDKITEYDRKNKTQLYTTFENLIENNDDINSVASKMFVHKNTIVYRRQRILQILGYNPFQAPYRLNFEIIFKIRQLKEL